MSKEAQISAEELRQAVAADMAEVLEKVAASINQARAGAIIADSEEIVREAMAEFRKKVYERAVQLAADKAAKAAFSPSGPCAESGQGAQQRPAKR
jgi:hypothetical protein